MRNNLDSDVSIKKFVKMFDILLYLQAQVNGMHQIKLIL